MLSNEILEKISFNYAGATEADIILIRIVKGFFKI